VGYLKQVIRDYRIQLRPRGVQKKNQQNAKLSHHPARRVTVLTTVIPDVPCLSLVGFLKLNSLWGVSVSVGQQKYGLAVVCMY
jgi:hypothetical protein